MHVAPLNDQPPPEHVPVMPPVKPGVVVSTGADAPSATPGREYEHEPKLVDVAMQGVGVALVQVAEPNNHAPLEQSWFMLPV